MTARLKSHDMSAVAERQMRSWALAIQALDQVQKERMAAEKVPKVKPYLALSREAGVDCAEIALAVANRRGWKLFDRELLEYLAEERHWNRVAMDVVDEKTVSWFHETFGQWLDNQSVSQVEFVRNMGKVVLLAAEKESVVIVGRGAAYYLPREAGTRVRIVAPRKYRIERIMKRFGLDRPKAESMMDEVDRGRAEFVRQYFHFDVADPHLYDLVINLECISRDEAVELVDQLLDVRR
jgi:cytidylate kinase